MGLALARELTVRGHAVDIIEQEDQLGGLATYHDFGGFHWDRFYHVILPSDRHLIQFIRDIGLAEELIWQKTYTGFYVDSRMHSISSNLEFLRFPLLNLIDKARLAWTLLYSSRIRNWRRLERVSVEDWLIRVSGRQTYEKMWRPLLLAKLGESYRRVSAVFIWSYVKRLFSARDRSVGAEQLGHVSGGYKMILDRVADIVGEQGGSIRTGETVTRIRPKAQTGIEVELQGSKDVLCYDKLICTSPVPILKKIVDPSLLRVENHSESVEYLGVICMVLVTTAPIVPFYVVNIADSSVPFTGIIGMSTVVSKEYTGGRYLTYLPKYVLSTDSWMKRNDAEIRKSFLDGLMTMLPDFDTAIVESVHINRAKRVQPLQVLNFSRHVPKVDTAHDDFFVLNTAQFLNATLNNNEVIGAVAKFTERYADQFPHRSI